MRACLPACASGAYTHTHAYIIAFAFAYASVHDVALRCKMYITPVCSGYVTCWLRIRCAIAFGARAFRRQRPRGGGAPPPALPPCPCRSVFVITRVCVCWLTRNRIWCPRCPRCSRICERAEHRPDAHTHAEVNHRRADAHASNCKLKLALSERIQLAQHWGLVSCERPARPVPARSERSNLQVHPAATARYCYYARQLPLLPPAGPHKGVSRIACALRC